MHLYFPHRIPVTCAWMEMLSIPDAHNVITYPNFRLFVPSSGLMKWLSISSMSRKLLYQILQVKSFNKLRLIQNCHHFADYQIIFWYDNCIIWNQISLKYIANGPVNKLTLDQILAWWQTSPWQIPTQIYMAQDTGINLNFHFLQNNRCVTNHMANINFFVFVFFRFRQNLIVKWT